MFGFSNTAQYRWIFAEKKYSILLVVAQKRFELLSKAPEASMLDHYTTGLRQTHRNSVRFYNFTVPL